ADVDCGGPCSTKCDNGKTCSSTTDCVSKVCSGNQCQAPMNHDNVMNGDETDVDCGGASGMKCANSLGCMSAGDCQSGVCTGSICAAILPACNPANCCGKNNCTLCDDDGDTSYCRDIGLRSRGGGSNYHILYATASYTDAFCRSADPIHGGNVMSAVAMSTLRGC
ncbi:unnamed protein product, partial [Adineta steineri]